MAAGLYDITNETLGKGHFAVVKLAKHCLTGELVAVKIIDKSRLNHDNLQQLGQEIRLLSRLSEKEHPNIVKLYQVIDTKTKLYLVMEYSGRDVCDLYDFIQRNDRVTGLNEQVAKHIFKQICSAISYCHSMRIVHRDLKPENILIVNQPEDIAINNHTKYPLVKLIDFGFSNQWKEGEKLRTSCGSLAYSAPEILLGDEYDGDKVDIWGLGCILYILLYGSNPFMQINDSETLIRILDCSYNAPPRPNISENAIALIKSLLKKDPTTRLSIQEILNFHWLQDNTGNKNNEETDVEEEMADLKKKLYSVKTNEENDNDKVNTSKEKIHDKVIDHMLSKGMCKSKEQIEYAIKKSRDIVNFSKSDIIKKIIVPNDENQVNDFDVLNEAQEMQSINISSNFCSITLKEENKFSNGTQEQCNPLNENKELSQQSYITATYHLLKDKLYREQRGINLTNQVQNKNQHYKKVLPVKPRKSIIKPPQFGIPVMRTTVENDEMSDNCKSLQEIANNCQNLVNNIKSLELPCEDESGFMLPLARKCSIVSEEGSCIGGDYSGNECGSDCVYDTHSINANNLNVLGSESLLSYNNDNCSCANFENKTKNLALVDIVVTDYSTIKEVDKISEDSDHDSNLDKLDNEKLYNTKSIHNLIECESLIKHDLVKNQTNIEISDETHSTSKSNLEADSILRSISCPSPSALHFVSSSPDLSHENYSNVNKCELFISNKKESSDDLVSNHVLNQLNKKKDSDDALNLNAGKTNSKLSIHTSMRVIMQSKSCNNIVYNGECKLEGKKKNSSKKYGKDKHKRNENADLKLENGIVRKTKTDKIDCCCVC